MPSPVAVKVVLTDGERAQLQAWARRPKSAQALALRSRIVLAAAEGLGNTQVAQRLGVQRSTVRIWRARLPRTGWMGWWMSRGRAGRGR
jgi:transposase